jgi:hypothetical protein
MAKLLPVIDAGDDRVFRFHCKDDGIAQGYFQLESRSPDDQTQGKQVVPMTDALVFEMNRQLDKLKECILTHNNQGDFYGLFSYHILNTVAEWRDEWEVLCDDDWGKSQFEENNAFSLASLGFSVGYSQLSDEALDRFRHSFDMLMQRDPFKGTHVSFAFQPIIIIGLILGIKKVSDDGWQKTASQWLSSIIDKRIEKGNLSGYHSLLYSYSRYLLNGSVAVLSIDPDEATIEKMSILLWATKRGIFKDKNSGETLPTIRHQLINMLVKDDITVDADDKAAMIWIAASEAISVDISTYLISPSYVSAVLSRFEDAMKRWRFDDPDKVKNPVRWPITSEKHVQDILWLILRAYFEDLVDEDALPKFGHKYHITDFAIPSLRLLIEVKYIYKRAEFKKIEEQIMVDSVAYLAKTQDYDKVMVFIYDESSSVQEHGTTKNDLMKIDAIEDVIIVSKPSQLGKP